MLKIISEFYLIKIRLKYDDKIKEYFVAI